MKLKPTNVNLLRHIVLNFLHVSVAVCSHLQGDVAQNMYYTDNQINVCIVTVMKYLKRESRLDGTIAISSLMLLVKVLPLSQDGSWVKLISKLVYLSSTSSNDNTVYQQLCVYIAF
jgi:hypothetical protein